MKTFILSCIALFTVISSLAGEMPGETFDRANKLYEEGKFQEAAQAYRGLLQSGSISSAVYFNLGNALLKSGETGAAIASFLKAEQISPRDPQVQLNLKKARESAQAPAFPPPALPFRVLNRITLNEMTTVAMVAGWAWLLLLILRQWQPSLKEKLKGYTAGVGLIFLLINLALVIQVTRHSAKLLIARNPTLELRRGPLPESESLGVVRPGTELKKIDEKGEWIQIVDPAGKVGWIPKTDAIAMTGPKANILL